MKNSRIPARVASATSATRRPAVVTAHGVGTALVLAAALAGNPRPAAGAGTNVVPSVSTGFVADEWIAPDVRVGRSELQISRFADPRAPDAVLAEILDGWRRRAAAVMHGREGGWLVATQADGAWVETVRLLSNGGGSAGLRIRQRTVARMPDAIASPGVERWLGARRVVSRTEQRDGSQVVTSWVLADGAGPDAVLEQARSAALADGFAQLSEPAASGRGSHRRAGAGDEAAASALWFRRRSDEILLTVTPHAAGSVAVLHWSRRR